jgi:hypothetical protein
LTIGLETSDREKEPKQTRGLGIDTFADLRCGSAPIKSSWPAIRALFEACDFFLAFSLWMAWSALPKDVFPATILGLLASAEDRSVWTPRFLPTPVGKLTNLFVMITS